MPVVLTVLCVLGLLGAAVAATDLARPAVVLAQPGHWTVDKDQRTALHLHGGTEQVDARVALPDDAAQNALSTLQGETEGFVVGRDRAWAFDKSTLVVAPPVPLPVTDEEPVGIGVPGCPYLVYRNRGTIVRLGAPQAVVEAGGPLGPPVRTNDGTVWVHRSDNGTLCAFRRGTVDLAAASRSTPAPRVARPSLGTRPRSSTPATRRPARSGAPRSPPGQPWAPTSPTLHRHQQRRRHRDRVAGQRGVPEPRRGGG